MECRWATIPEQVLAGDYFLNYFGNNFLDNFLLWAMGGRRPMI
jgi:hypothetical protein